MLAKFYLAGILMLLAAGSTNEVQPVSQKVFPTAETEPVPSSDDAADDSAIWVNPQHPEASLIIATDKRSGLLTYNLEGKQLQHLVVGNLNNVDLRQGAWGTSDSTLVVASQRKPSQLVLLTLDHKTQQLEVRSQHNVPIPQAYGVCLYQDEQSQPFAILSGKSGMFYQYAISPEFEINEVRHWAVDSQAEGCVADDDSGQLYLGEEGMGIWQMSARPNDPVDKHLFDTVASGRLHPDIEGLALYNSSPKILIASSQGNDTFVMYDVSNNTHLTSFQISGDRTIDGVTETDGLEVTTAALPGYPHGLLVVHDGYNDKPARNQNFKLVSWESVSALIQ